jgi:hypothetical protein
MDCAAARKRLWPADVLRVSDAEVEAALNHAENCSACQVFLEEDRRVAQLIRETVPPVQAPRELRERLYTALARERAGLAVGRVGGRGRRRWATVAVLTAALLVAGSAGYRLLTKAATDSAATAFAEDYLRRVVEQEELKTADRAEIAAFFARELGVAMPPPEIPGFELKRASICLMNGRRGGVVEYRSPFHQLSYYVIPGESTAEADRKLVAVAGKRAAIPAAPAIAEESGLGVATWWDGRHQHALVGDVSSRELLRLAIRVVGP